MFFLKKVKPKLAVIAGTRPNFIKLAPFMREAKKHNRFNYTVIHTGQHFDQNMSKVFFQEMEIPLPDIYLNPGGQYHTEKIALMIDKLKSVFKEHKFDGVVVFGDVNSTLAGALATIKYNSRLIHVEAGLRSNDRRMPEEINRVIVDHLAHLHFVTEQSGVDNLKREGVKDKKIHLVGNIMIEALENYKDRINDASILKKLDLSAKSYLLMTLHRQENTDNKQTLEYILNVALDLAKFQPIVFPLHPGTKKQIYEYGLESLLSKLNCVSPMGYFDFVKLIKESSGVITDSGGIQEETSHLGIPCCTLRDNTERPITLEFGSNNLFPIFTSSSQDLIKHLNRQDFSSGQIPFWDDQVSQRIFNILDHWDI